MKAMVLEHIWNLHEHQQPLVQQNVAVPEPNPHEILVKVSACGVCHTELDEIEGRTPPSHFPMIPGHQVVGRVVAGGQSVTGFQIGDRVGIAWIYSACGHCDHCRSDQENLCREFVATGRDVNGGYAEYMTVHEDFAHAIPAQLSDAEAAPLLCAGAVGYRSLRLSGLQNGQRLGLTGFGASAHLVLKMLGHLYPKSQAFVFARNERERDFAREIGAVWAGNTTDRPPELLHCIIDTTPAWKPVLEALQNLTPGGRLVINAIRKEMVDQEYLLNLDYPIHLWMEKEIKSVANVERRDVREFLRFAATIPLRPEIEEFALEDANQALMEVRHRKIRGAKVLRLA